MTDQGSDDTAPATTAGPVESLYDDYQGLLADLSDRSPSGLTALNRSFHKVVLIAAASNLEARVKRIVKNIFEERGRVELGVFVEKAVMARSYHTLFNWDGGKATGFFRSFGDECTDRFKRMLAENDYFRGEHDAFMQLGTLRNQLVHQDYAVFTLDTTPEELIQLYRQAIRFPERFESIIFHAADSN